jgi:hypothetical protein
MNAHPSAKDLGFTFPQGNANNKSGRPVHHDVHIPAPTVLNGAGMIFASFYPVSGRRPSIA